MESRGSWFYDVDDKIKYEPERALARAKIIRMIQDLLVVHMSVAEKEYCKFNAMNWFFECSDAEYWFEVAGYDWESSVLKIKELYHKHINGLSDITRRMVLKKVANGEGKRYEERKKYWAKEKERNVDKRIRV